jgi:hypothetical protein
MTDHRMACAFGAARSWRGVALSVGSSISYLQAAPGHDPALGLNPKYVGY